MGTSLGGWTAAELAVRNTSKLASLTLVCAVGITADGVPMDDIFRMSAEENACRFYFDPERVKRRLDALAAADVRVAAKNRSTVVRLGYPRFLNPDLAKWLHRIDIPTLLLWGENDGLVPPRFGHAYRALIPNSELVVIPRAGHVPFEEQPDAFLDAFGAFQTSRASSRR
jgi:pimeloyl-ACP methyl ester carboxylesterase